MNLHSLVSRYAQVRAERLELERKAKEIAQGEEAELRKTILLEMSAQGFKSVNIEGIGRVVNKETSHYEIGDIELFARTMFETMLAAAREGRPFSDGLLLQKRISREGIENLTEQGAALDAMGVSRVIRQDLSITKV